MTARQPSSPFAITVCFVAAVAMSPAYAAGATRDDDPSSTPVATDTASTPMLLAQRRPPARRHTANESETLSVVESDSPPIAANRVAITVESGARIIRSNSIAAHNTGAFPNAGNPHGIVEQSVEVVLPLAPQVNATPTFYQLGTFGIATNGVIFEPQAAEWYLGEHGSQWQYDPLGGAVALGLDANFAHVQPDGLYHYHGLPTGLLRSLDYQNGDHGPLVGWAMDGFPIYALIGTDDSGVARDMTSSWRLKSGARPGDGPGGVHDGTFVADYEYIAGSGDLDACNGRDVVTSEFPDGTYAYFLTADFPVVPRCFSGTPISGAIVLDQAGRRVN